MTYYISDKNFKGCIHMRIAIGMCGKTAGKCCTMGCFKAYNKKDKYFEIYKDIDTELMAFFNCQLCFEDGVEKLDTIAGKLKENQVKNVHLGACAVKCKEDKLEDIKKTFTGLGMDVIEGTH